jgi:peptidoglycan/LPS O-acetylase OafA/YrhL
MGMLIGAICFHFQGGAVWPGISQVPVWKMLLVMLIGFTLIPVPSSLDIRGWSEMHPLNGPAWSLFYEYVANILYGVFVRRFSNTALAILVFIAGGALLHMAVSGTNGDLIGGWSLEPAQLRIGITRLCYPFFAGLLLSRIIKIRNIKNAFLWCSLFIVAALCVPRIGGPEHTWMNGLYDSLCVIALFPLIVYTGACGSLNGSFAKRSCKFLGNISYPVYIIHYPLIYIYTNWVNTNKIPLTNALPVALVVFISIVILAFACLKLYDEPVRKWLQGKWLK